MDGMKDAYQDVEPVTLRLDEANVTAQIYCRSSKSIEAHLSSMVEAFLVEVFRCRICQFTSAQKASICSHVTESHSLPSSNHNLSTLEKEEEENLTVHDEDAHLDQSRSLYNLHSVSKNNEDHIDMDRMSFLLPVYGMLENISPPPCDMGLSSNSDSNLHVAQTCEVSTLFEEGRHSDEETIFQLEDARDGLHGPLSTEMTCAEEEKIAQSAHLMTLGLCRISNTKCAPATVTEPAPIQDVSETVLHDRQALLATSKMQKEAEEEIGLTCVFCQEALSTHSLLELHLKCHDGEQGFKCPHCDWGASEWADMECHWRSHGKRPSSKPHRCAVCPRTFRKADIRDAHEKKHKRVGLKSSHQAQCSFCLKRCQSEQELKIHQQCHFQGGFKCLYCDFKEKSWKKLHKHTSSQHGQADGDPENQVSYSVETLKLNSQTSSNSFTKCLGGLQPESWLHLRKIKVKHKIVQRKKNVEDKGGHVKHIENERSETLKIPKLKEFCCTLCNKKFSTKLTMRRHMGIHQGDKPFKCPHCHYSTRLKASLTQHMRVHTGEKPYKCPLCSYASIDRSSLRRHLRTHTQEKPYCCQYCPYSCIQKKSLDLHSRRHHTGESFPCSLCQYTTPDRQLLLRHTRKHHSTETSVLLAPRTAPSTKRPKTSK